MRHERQSDNQRQPLAAGRTRWLWLLPVLSGLLMAAAFPPLNLGLLAWFALLPLFYFCTAVPPRHALAGGLICGLIFQLHLNLYVGNVMVHYLNPFWGGALLFLLVCYLALYVGLFGYALALAWRRLSPLLLMTGAAALWVAFEYLRSTTFLGYNAGFIGHTQWQYPLLLRLAATYGYWGLAFLLVAWQLLLLLLAHNRRFNAAPAACFLLGIAAGLALPSLMPAHAAEQPLRAALLQGNNAQEEILSAEGARAAFTAYLDMSRQAAARYPDLQLIVWPETVVSLNLQSVRPAAFRELRELVNELGIPVLYGAMIEEDSAFYNAILLEDGSSPPQRYNKHRLVPFVEYFPVRGLLNKIVPLDMQLGFYTPGSRNPGLFSVCGQPVGAAVCFESYFGDHTRRLAARGSRHLFVLTNDAWFGRSIGLDQHAQVGAIRAAEMGTGFTQVANTGITITFDHRGAEIGRAPVMERAIVLLEADLSTRLTLYRLAGDYLAYLSLCYTLALALLLKKRLSQLPQT